MNNGMYEHVAVFAAIAQAGSLTGASVATGIGQATISRQLAALEEQLGCRLFQRSTRAISLTEQGEAFLPHALRLLDAMAEAQAAVQDGRQRLRGRIRVACSHGFGKKLLMPMLAQWQRRQPDVQVELVLSDQLSQLIGEQVDVAFRIGELPESGLVARTIGTFQRIVVAAPDYLKKHGAVREPAELRRHQCILFSGAREPGVWRLGDTEVRVHGRLMLSTLDGIYDAVLAGLGIAVMPEWFWTSELLDGRVRKLLPRHPLPERTISAVTTARAAAGSKTGVFVAFVEEGLRQRIAVPSGNGRAAPSAI